MILGVHFGDFGDDFCMKIENWRQLEKSHGVQARAPKLKVRAVGNDAEIKNKPIENVAKN